MKVLIIDSHKSSNNNPQASLHWQNAKILADYFKADLIWSYPTVNDNIKTDYDVIIFCHSSAYSFVSTDWVRGSPNAKLFFLSNDYVMGESMLLWAYVKEANKKYTVIANHKMEYSLKANTKWIDKWEVTNLNSLIFDPNLTSTFQSSFLSDFFDDKIKWCCYYGAYRKDRAESFFKYLPSCITSTHPKNIDKFRGIGVNSRFVPRLDILSGGLTKYAASLYIEDETTHTDYSCLANRFYEALNSNVPLLFDSDCLNTLTLSGYENIFPKDLIVSSGADILSKVKMLDGFSWSQEILSMANDEKQKCILDIERIINE